jgi:16S rRNA (uracil1498-N3)-methyltransferase
LNGYTIHSSGIVALQRLIVSPEQLDANHINLTSEQQHYLYRVLRLSAGQQFMALDGKGGQWLATLTTPPNTATIIPLEPRPSKEMGRPAVSLAIAIPKGSGFDDLVRQTTELGVVTLQPVITERTLQRPSNKKLERWQRIAAEATEQSERLLLPTIPPPIAWKDFVAQASGTRLICVARRSNPHLLTHLRQRGPSLPDRPIILATGPEGGWTAEEIDLALTQGFVAVSLGSTILRAITAPVAALSILMACIDTLDIDAADATSD